MTHINLDGLEGSQSHSRAVLREPITFEGGMEENESHLKAEGRGANHILWRQVREPITFEGKKRGVNHIRR